MTYGDHMSRIPSITDIMFPPPEFHVEELEFQPTWSDSVGHTEFESTWPDSFGKDGTTLRFNLEDIIVATNNFAEGNIVKRELDFLVYEGELSGKKLAFVSVWGGVLNIPRLVQFSSSTKQENIVSLDGFCDQDGKLILVFEHPARGRLDKYVSSTTHLTWLRRIQICLDVARGLQYLQSHIERNDLKVTELINSANIYLDTNWQAKIQFIRPSALVDLYQAPSVSEFGRHNNSSYKGQLGYADSSYIETGIQSLDLYSFGVLLFELLCGRLAVTGEEKNQQFLSRLAITHYQNGTLAEFIDPALWVQMNRDSFTVFSELAYACLCDSPTIFEAVEGLEKVLRLAEGFKTSNFQQVTNIEDLKIPLKEIQSATHHSIGTTGKVYKADLSHFNVDKYFAENKIRRVSREEILKYPRRKSTFAIKNIDGGFGEQTGERLQTLLSLSHENLVKLVGFCDEDDECIHVVYEYASKGSLDEYIRRQHTNYQKYIDKHETMRNIFPWVIRLQFCLDAARGLNVLHNGNEKNHSIIHGNIKSSNILIGRDGVGMIGDFGLSTNQNTHTLTGECDVFSFGLVLFEVLSGQLTHFKITESDPDLLPEIVKLGFKPNKLDKIVDPMLKQEFENDRSSIMDEPPSDSIKMFADIAYRCFKPWKYTMANIVEELEKAYKYYVKSSEKRQENEDNSKMESLKHLKIPFKDIYSATHGFEDVSRIGKGGFGGVYTAELFHVDVRKYVGKKEYLVEHYGYPRRKGKVALKRREITSGQGRKEFLKEIDVLSGLNHQNLISLVGFCYEYGEMIIIYDYASNESFDGYIRKNPNLKWGQRLQICIDAAQGLNYLHNHHIIHRDVKGSNILLGDSLEGIIGDVGLSITIKSADSQVIDNPAGTPGYIDPKYYTRGILTKQSDMYSFGVVLLEVLCGNFVSSDLAKNKVQALLVEKAEPHLATNQPYQIIGDYLRKDLKNEKLLDSVKKFAAITHECLHSTETHRLTMADILKELKKAMAVHLIGVETILLEDINSATENFNDKRVIGSGASGKVYKGELTLFKKSIPVAVKRLDKAHSYGEGAFLKEVVKLSRYVHDNIITLRGFCEEDDEKIIIMDHASNESLDRYLDKSILTWGIRLKICIGAAKGLNYIHSFEEDQETVHGDIKSSNILLDQDWNATISDFIICKSHGTLGYLDPQYSLSGATKASDVYSFGVVLFELLSGRLAIEKVERYSDHPTLRQIINVSAFAEQTSQSSFYGAKDKKVFLAWMVARCFEEKKQCALIFDDIKEQTDAKSIDILLEVAYECLQKDQAKRPTMGSVIKELEKALNIHEEWEFAQTLPKDNENIMKMIEHPESREITKKDLNSIFSSGILLNNGKLLLSLNKDGKAKEMISATTFSYEKCWSSKRKVLDKSRFGTVAKISDTSNLKIGIKIKTQFLSLGIIYGAFLVFRFCDPKIVSSKLYVNLKYRTASGKLNSYTVERKDSDWMMIELCRFRNQDQIIDFEVQLKSFCGHPCGNGPIFIDGIEFRPINNVDHEESVDRSINADSSVNWEQQSPSDFQEVMKRSQYDVLAMKKPELDKSTGVLINNGEKLFSQSKVNCKKSHMLPAKAVINKSPDAKFTKCPSSALSRFEEVAELQFHKAFSIKCNIETQMLSPDTAYACNLVFQLPENCKGLNCPVKARDLLNKNNKESTIIYLKAPFPVDLYRDKRVPENREDGWMEVRVWEFVYNNEIKDNYIPMELKLVCLGGTMSGLIICGVEFQPM